MAVCKWCKKDMSSKKTMTCSGNDLVHFPQGKGPSLSSVPYDGEGRCHDCNIAPGGMHHPGCDMERCPKCGGRLISCGCLDEEDEEEEEEE